jgi:predicted double-glycine peptidase
MPNSNSHTLRTAHKVLKKYIESNKKNFTQEQVDDSIHLKRLLLSLENTYNHLVNLNNKLIINDAPKFNTLQDDDAIYFNVLSDDNKFTFKIPKTNKGKHVDIGSHGHGGFYTPNTEDASVLDNIKLQMETNLGTYYAEAFRAIKLARSITNNKKFDCRPINIVRNKLIEHAKEEGLTFHNFGYSSSAGPTIKPVRRISSQRSNREIHHDQGLFHNNSAFVNSLITLFS